MISIVDYGVGNIQAIANIYKRLNIPVKIARKAEELVGAERLILPGVGAFDWAMGRLNKSGMRGVLNDAISIYFPDPALADAFVARWCIGYKVETAGGALRVREDEPEPRVGAGLHRTP